MNMRMILIAIFIFTSLYIKAQERRQTTGFLSQSGTMAERWELSKDKRKALFIITPYKPVYVSVARWSSNPNKQPTSENPSYTLPFPIDYNQLELKFQLSFKTKVSQGIFWGHGDLWVAYTQKAHWQVYNTKLSRPFRELNYEPEVILNFGTNYSVAGFKGSMIGLSLTHQSNGRTLPLSRSWNRIIFHAGFEKEHWQVVFRPWIRLHDDEDENPAILDYVGRAEALVVYNPGRHQFSAVASHSLRFENGGKGSLQLNWAFPIRNNLHGHLEMFEGYGETLQDYNHRQTTIGIGVSLVDW